jgi:hypothetical protein
MSGGKGWGDPGLGPPPQVTPRDVEGHDQALWVVAVNSASPASRR